MKQPKNNNRQIMLKDSQGTPIHELPLDAAKALGAALAEFIMMRQKTAEQKPAAANY